MAVGGYADVQLSHQGLCRNLPGDGTTPSVESLYIQRHAVSRGHPDDRSVSSLPGAHIVCPRRHLEFLLARGDGPRALRGCRMGNVHPCVIIRPEARTGILCRSNIYALRVHDYTRHSPADHHAGCMVSIDPLLLPAISRGAGMALGVCHRPSPCPFDPGRFSPVVPLSPSLSLCLFCLRPLDIIHRTGTRVTPCRDRCTESGRRHPLRARSCRYTIAPDDGARRSFPARANHV